MTALSRTASRPWTMSPWPRCDALQLSSAAKSAQALCAYRRRERLAVGIAKVVRGSHRFAAPRTLLAAGDRCGGARVLLHIAELARSAALASRDRERTSLATRGATSASAASLASRASPCELKTLNGRRSNRRTEAYGASHPRNGIPQRD